MYHNIQYTSERLSFEDKNQKGFSFENNNPKEFSFEDNNPKEFSFEDKNAAHDYVTLFLQQHQKFPNFNRL